MIDFVADYRVVYSMLTGSAVRRHLGCLRTPGLHALLVFRLGSFAGTLPLPARIPLLVLHGILNFLICAVWGIELPRQARIGPGLYIGHFGGIIISPDAVIGPNCFISHGCTLGIAGQGARRGAPTLGLGCYIGPGAKLYGPIHLGDHVRVGPNAVVYRNVPAGAVVQLSPGFEIVQLGGQVTTDRDLA